MRLFLAWPLPETLKREVEIITGELRGRLPRASWTKASSMHLTLAFLGETDPSRIDPLKNHLAPLRALSPIDVTLAGAGFFPNSRRPRVLWLGIEPPDPVVALAASARSAIIAAGASFDPKPFRPHLTLARLRESWRERETGAVLSELEGWRSSSGRLDRVVLFESRLSPGGAVHTPLVEVTLGEG